MVAPTTTPTIMGSRFNWCLPITLSMRYFVEAGRTKPLARLIIINRKLPPRSRRRGLTSFHTSGRTFFSLGLGRAAVRSAAVARPVPREGRSADFIPGEPKLEWPKEDILVEVYPFGRFGARVRWCRRILGMDRPCLSAVYACSIWSCGAPPAGLEPHTAISRDGQGTDLFDE